MKEILKIFKTKMLLELELQKGIVVGAATTIFLLYLINGIGFQSGYGKFLDLLVMIIIGLVGYFILIWIISFILYLLKKIPIIIISIIVAAIIMMFVSQSLPDVAFLVFILGFVFLGMMTGGLLGIVIDEKWKTFGSIKKQLFFLSTFVVVLLNVTFFIWIVSSGSNSHLLEINPIYNQNNIAASNPLDKGDFTFSTFSYGSGISERIPEYGSEADIITKTVDISHLVSMKDLESKLREFYWGFDLKTVPLNAQVWMPNGDGPFPLVMIVHGNHNMTEFSEGGYSYLGEHLASHGYIFVSIDENFLNGYFTGSLKNENDARAKIILEHLGMWEDWNRNPNFEFYKKVDMENIALMGHSRGGEAVSIATVMNTLERSPNNSVNVYNYDFSIKSVIAISPTDGQYKMAGKPMELEDINYLVIQGSHDSDISRFDGIRQYNRVFFSNPESGLFKSAILIDRANHSQFNTVWSPTDKDFPNRLLLNRKPIMEEETQRDILLLFSTAFLDVTLTSEKEYLPIFENYQNAGGWLPETLFMNQYQSSSFISIANFEEDVDTLSTKAGRIETTGLSIWRELSLKHRSGKEMENQVVEIGWSNNHNSSYSIVIENEIEVSIEDSLSFSLVDIREFDGEFIDFSIELIDQKNNSAKVILSDYGRLLPQFHVVFTKYKLWEDATYKSETEPMLQTFLIPFIEFLNQNEQINLGAIKEIKLIFNQTESGHIYLDEIGIEK